jgi:hypothetical protein
MNKKKQKVTAKIKAKPGTSLKESLFKTAMQTQRAK